MYSIYSIIYLFILVNDKLNLNLTLCDAIYNKKNISCILVEYLVQ